MKTLIAEDDFSSRLLLQKILAPYGETHIAVDGKEAIDAFKTALEINHLYDLICLDIMMPEMDGQAVLKEIRKLEKEKGTFVLDGVKVIMTTALSDYQNITEAFTAYCEAYLIKPIDKRKLLDEISNLGLL